jgi:hypothetical protein
MNTLKSQSTLPKIIGIIMTAFLLGAAFGLVAVTTNPLLIGLAASTIIGAVFFVKPALNIWTIIILGLFVSGILPIWVEGFANKIVWGISILGFVVLLSAVGKTATSHGSRRETPAFVWMALAFMIYATAISIIQWHSLGEFIAGFKRYFQMFGLLFALAWLSFDRSEVLKWKRAILILALAQLPWALYELIYLVPIRESVIHLYKNLVPIDVVAGTFGSARYSGGANGEMASFLIIILAFILAKWRERLIKASTAFLIGIPIAAPLFLGETKVVIVLLPLMALLIFRKDILAKPHVAVAAMAIAGTLTFAAGYIYLSWSDKTAEEQIEQTLSYNIYDKGYGSAYLNRSTVITFWAQEQSLADPLSFVIGNGLGSSHDATLGHVSAQYPGYRIGLTAASTLLWDTGILGTSIFLLIFALAWKEASRLAKLTTDKSLQAEINAIQAAIALFVFHLIYRLTPLETLTYQIFMFLTLGYLAWLSQQTRRVTTP